MHVHVHVYSMVGTKVPSFKASFQVLPFKGKYRKCKKYCSYKISFLCKTLKILDFVGKNSVLSMAS